MNLKKMLIRHEGLKLEPYIDTVGKLSLGVGRNIEDNGISEEEALFMLDNDIRRTKNELEMSFPWFSHLCTARRDALIDMCFNLGLTRFRQFRNMISALEAGNYAQAAAEALDSRWARQVGHRANELSEMIRTGEYSE